MPTSFKFLQLSLSFIILICVNELGTFAGTGTQKTHLETQHNLNFVLNYDEFGFVLLHAHQPIVDEIEDSFLKKPKNVSKGTWLDQLRAALGNGLKKITKIKSHPDQNESKFATSIEHKVHKPLRESLNAVLEGEQVPDELKKKFALLVLVDIGQKLAAKCLELYQDENRKIALEWWQSFRERLRSPVGNIHLDITRVSPDSPSHLKLPLSQLCHQHRRNYAISDSEFNNFALSKLLNEFRQKISIGIKYDKENQRQGDEKTLEDGHANENAKSAAEHPIEISVYKFTSFDGITTAFQFQPALYFDNAEIHFINNGIWMKKPGTTDSTTLKFVGLRSLANVKTRVTPQKLQQILDQWEIEGKFGHGTHSHVDNNGVDFVLDLIGEIHAVDEAQEFPPKEVHIMQMRQSAEDVYKFKPVAWEKSVEWPPEYLKQSPWIESNRKGHSSSVPFYNALEKWILDQVANLVTKRRD